MNTVANTSLQQKLETGHVLSGRYEIVSEIGKGSMGILYKARHIRLGGYVAIKVLNNSLAKNPKMIARFHREAQLSSKVKHPNVIQIIDYDLTPWGTPFLVQEFLEGKDLQRCLNDKERFSIDDIVEIMTSICDALHAAHLNGVVHRDIKPANIMISRNMSGSLEAKLLDFGLAEVWTKTEADASNGYVVVGTPFYMSPEQLLGKQLDARSDIYAMGVILYQLLCGHLPFEGTQVMEIAHQVLHIEPENIEENARKYSIPRYLAALAMKSICKQRKERPKTALRFKDELFAKPVALPRKTVEAKPFSFVRRIFTASAA